jgi:hypothetical protein
MLFIFLTQNFPKSTIPGNGDRMSEPTGFAAISSSEYFTDSRPMIDHFWWGWAGSFVNEG